MSASYLLRDMQLADLEHVLAIDRTSFPTPWSESTYRFELKNRGTSHLVVLEQRDQDGAETPGFQRLIRRMLGHAPTSGPIIGYGGCWLIAGESHISTIAVHPAHRGHGLGELLLAAMLRRTMNMGAEYSVLEVRESNLKAQALYKKYEYRPEGRRKGYYRDNSEDALLMTARPLDAAYRQRFDDRMDTLAQRINFVDLFSNPDNRKGDTR